MKAKVSSTHAVLTLQKAETELLELALKRAMFDDTPPERQRDIVDFATALLRMLGSAATSANEEPSGTDT